MHEMSEFFPEKLFYAVAAGICIPAACRHRLSVFTAAVRLVVAILASVEGGVEGVEVSAVQTVLGDSERFAEIGNLSKCLQIYFHYNLFAVIPIQIYGIYFFFHILKWGINRISYLLLVLFVE